MKVMEGQTLAWKFVDVVVCPVDLACQVPPFGV